MAMIDISEQKVTNRSEETLQLAEGNSLSQPPPETKLPIIKMYVKSLLCEMKLTTKCTVVPYAGPWNRKRVWMETLVNTKENLEFS